jgi:dipeptidyl aminopeptidase/acylaminoacyl peptidase
MTPADIAGLVDVSDPRLSPDGTQVAFVVTTMDLTANTYRSRVWLAPVDGSVAARAVTAGDQRDARPRWSPDGRSLAFVSHREAAGSQLYVLPASGPGELVKVAAWPEEIEDLEWSPDGTRLAFTARDRDEERYGKDKDGDRPARRIDRLLYRLDNVGWTLDRPRHLFVVDAGGLAAPQLVLGGENVAGVAWSADGAWLFTTSGRHETWDVDLRTDVFRVPAGGGEAEQLTATTATLARPAMSPAGTHLACSWRDPARYPGFSQVAVLDLAARPPAEARVVTDALDRELLLLAREPVWDGEDVMLMAEDGGRAHLYRSRADGSGKPELLVGGERQLTGFDRRAGVTVFVATSTTSLPELFVVADGDPAERSVASPGRAFRRRTTLADAERFTAVAPDGAEVDAWVMRPASFEAGRRYPTLLNIHGGPMTQYGDRFFDEFQVQAGAGYAVLFSNPRGSSGADQDWARAICGPKSFHPGSGWGVLDYDDLMAVVDGALARYDFLDGDRLGVLGGSYGGFMASWIVGHTRRFRAACSERAVNNHLSMAWASDIGIRLGRDYFGVSHLDDPDEYLRQSPITYVRDIDTPVLILHSEADLRCPVEQAEQLFVALKVLGKEVEFVRFPGESHELSRSGTPRHRIERMEIVLDWFGRKLQSHGARAVTDHPAY